MLYSYLFASILLKSAYSCDENCNSCVNNVCEQCSYGYFKSGDSCLSCGAGCRLCLSQTECSICYQGYFRNSQYQCIGCPVVCSTCSNNVCSTCMTGYQIRNNICCPLGCRGCTLAGCTSCFDGYYLNDVTCAECSSDCLTCDASGCITCKTGFSKSDGVCVQNTCSVTGCQTCSGTSCKVCSTGYYLSNGGCTKCPEGCGECAGQWQCSSCLAGYSKKYDVCCKNGCSSCSPAQVCWTCEEKYFAQSGKCLSCPSSCTDCSNGVCIRCHPGFYMNISSCSSCPSECSTCDSYTWCSACKTGYRFSSGKCVV